MKKVLVLLLFVFSFSLASFSASVNDDSNTEKVVVDVGIFDADIIAIANLEVDGINSETIFVLNSTNVEKIETIQKKHLDIVSDVGWDVKEFTLNKHFRFTGYLKSFKDSLFINKHFRFTGYEFIRLQKNISLLDAKKVKIKERYKNSIYARFNLWLI